MATVKAPVQTDQIPKQHRSDSDTVSPSTNGRKYIACGSYKEAKYLAGSMRRDGEHAFAVYVVAQDRWCVR